MSLEGLFGIIEAIGIIATLFVRLYFSRKQMQSLSVDIQTKVLVSEGQLKYNQTKCQQQHQQFQQQQEESVLQKVELEVVV